MQTTLYPCTASPPMEATASRMGVRPSPRPTAPSSWRKSTAWRIRPARKTLTVCPIHPTPSAPTPQNPTPRRLQEGSRGPQARRPTTVSRNCHPRKAPQRRTVAQLEKIQITLPAARNTPSKSSRSRKNEDYMNWRLCDPLPLWFVVLFRVK